MPKGLVTPELQLQLEGYGLSLIEVHYFMPDHPNLLQLFAFQQRHVGRLADRVDQLGEQRPLAVVALIGLAIYWKRS